jgi:hypothetical protein
MLFRPYLSVSLIAGAIAFAGAAMAQASGSDARPKVAKAHVVLKGGAKVQVVQPEIVDRKLCGYVRPADAPANTAWKQDCIAMSDIADTLIEGAKHALGESIDGSMCMVLMPLCLAKVSAVQDRIFETAIGKAQSRAPAR